MAKLNEEQKKELQGYLFQAFCEFEKENEDSLAQLIDDLQNDQKFLIEYFNYLGNLRYDCPCAIRTTTGQLRKKYVKRENSLVKALAFIHTHLL